MPSVDVVGNQSGTSEFNVALFVAFTRVTDKMFKAATTGVGTVTVVVADTEPTVNVKVIEPLPREAVSKGKLAKLAAPLTSAAEPESCDKDNPEPEIVVENETLLFEVEAMAPVASKAEMTKTQVGSPPGRKRQVEGA